MIMVVNLQILHPTKSLKYWSLPARIRGSFWWKITSCFHHCLWCNFIVTKTVNTIFGLRLWKERIFNFNQLQIFMKIQLPIFSVQHETARCRRRWKKVTRVTGFPWQPGQLTLCPLCQRMLRWVAVNLFMSSLPAFSFLWELYNLLHSDKRFW